MKLEASCCLCSAAFKASVKVPDTWAFLVSQFDAPEFDCLCPDHVAVADFPQSQCPGCVGGWGDCPLWRSFAYSDSRDITPADFASIERGVCPKRVNGTMVLGSDGLEHLDLSKPASPEAGKALADGIRQYLKDYPPSR